MPLSSACQRDPGTSVDVARRRYGDASEMMDDLGHVVVAEAGSLAAARPLAETAEFDLAILDINIGGFNIQPIAEIIERRGLPFLFVTGYGAAGLPETFRDRPVLDKPCSFQNLKQSVDLLLHS